MLQCYNNGAFLFLWTVHQPALSHGLFKINDSLFSNIFILAHSNDKKKEINIMYLSSEYHLQGCTLLPGRSQQKKDRFSLNYDNCRQSGRYKCKMCKFKKALPVIVNTAPWFTICSFLPVTKESIPNKHLNAHTTTPSGNITFYWLLLCTTSLDLLWCVVYIAMLYGSVYISESWFINLLK